MNTINFIIVVSMVLLSTDLVYHQVNGQTEDPCIISKMSNLAIVDSSCSGFNASINTLIQEGFELKLSNNAWIYE
jgi:hypothetical protein